MARKLRYNDEEGGMAKAQLQKIEMYAAKLNEMIHPEDELEAWVQAKLAVAAQSMGDVKHYLDYELKQSFKDGGPVMSERYWEVEFTWDTADEDESRKVNVMADDVSDAERKVKAKFAPYYMGLRIIEVEEDKKVSWEEYSERRKKDFEEGKRFDDGGETEEDPGARMDWEYSKMKDKSINDWIDSQDHKRRTEEELIKRGYGVEGTKRLMRKFEYLIETADTPQEAADDVEKHKDDPYEFPEFPKLKFKKGGEPKSKHTEITFVDSDGSREVTAKFKRAGDAYIAASSLNEVSKPYNKKFVVNPEAKGRFKDGGGPLDKIPVKKLTLKDLEEYDGMYYVGHLIDHDGDGWVLEDDALKALEIINKGEYSKGGETKYKGLNVEIRPASKNSKKFVIWDVETDQKFANEKFDSHDEAIDFINQNKMAINGGGANQSDEVKMKIKNLEGLIEETMEAIEAHEKLAKRSDPVKNSARAYHESKVKEHKKVLANRKSELEELTKRRMADGGHTADGEAGKVFVEISKPKDLTLNRVKRQIEDFAEAGYKSADVLLKMAFVTDEPKQLTDQFQVLKNKVYLLRDVKKYYKGGKTDDLYIKNEGSTFEEDFKEAKDLLGAALWKAMTYEERVEATKYLKATGKIGYFGEYEDLTTVAAMQYRQGGKTTNQ